MATALAATNHVVMADLKGKVDSRLVSRMRRFWRARRGPEGPS
jgi:hypothetical protein